MVQRFFRRKNYQIKRLKVKYVVIFYLKFLKMTHFRLLNRIF